MTKQQILEAYKGTGYNAQNLIKLLDEKLQDACKTSSFDESLAVFETKEFVVMVSTNGVELFNL